MKYDEKEKKETREDLTLEGRNAVMEGLRAGMPLDRVYLQDNLQDPALKQIEKAAREAGIRTDHVPKEKLQKLSRTGRHQGVIALIREWTYYEPEDLLKEAEKRGEAPFIILLDGIEDPHNLGAIIRTANLSGAHGVIIPKNRAASLNATVARTSAGAVNFTKVARVTNLAKTIEELKEKGLWFVSADMDGEIMYDLNLKGPIGLVVGAEGKGVSRLIREKCDMTARIPMKGDIDSLNASVAAGVLAYEIVRQRMT